MSVVFADFISVANSVSDIPQTIYRSGSRGERLGIGERSVTAHSDVFWPRSISSHSQSTIAPSKAGISVRPASYRTQFSRQLARAAARGQHCAHCSTLSLCIWETRDKGNCELNTQHNQYRQAKPGTFGCCQRNMTYSITAYLMQILV